MKKFCAYFGGAIMLVVFIAVFAAYFVTSFDPETHTWFDGLGRPLSEAPIFMRLVFGQERLWAGWMWFILDMAIFWGGAFAGFSLLSFGIKEKADEE